MENISTKSLKIIVVIMSFWMNIFMLKPMELSDILFFAD